MPRTLRLDDELLSAVTALARRHCRSVAGEIEWALRLWVEVAAAYDEQGQAQVTASLLLPGEHRHPVVMGRVVTVAEEADLVGRDEVGPPHTVEREEVAPVV